MWFMNIFQFSTNKKCWIFDFLILVIELMISYLPKRLRLIFESADPLHHDKSKTGNYW